MYGLQHAGFGAYQGLCLFPGHVGQDDFPLDFHLYLALQAELFQQPFQELLDDLGILLIRLPGGIGPGRSIWSTGRRTLGGRGTVVGGGAFGAGGFSLLAGPFTIARPGAGLHPYDGVLPANAQKAALRLLDHLDLGLFLVLQAQFLHGGFHRQLD